MFYPFQDREVAPAPVAPALPSARPEVCCWVFSVKDRPLAQLFSSLDKPPKVESVKFECCRPNIQDISFHHAFFKFLIEQSDEFSIFRVNLKWLFLGRSTLVRLGKCADVVGLFQYPFNVWGKKCISFWIYHRSMTGVVIWELWRFLINQGELGIPQLGKSWQPIQIVQHTEGRLVPGRAFETVKPLIEVKAKKNRGRNHEALYVNILISV